MAIIPTTSKISASADEENRTDYEKHYYLVHCR